MPFKKGQSGNKRGRPPKSEYERYCQKEFEKALKECSPDALEVLVSLMRRGDNSTRLKAAQFILDKSFGSAGGFLLDKEPERQSLTINLIPKTREDMDNEF